MGENASRAERMRADALAQRVHGGSARSLGLADEHGARPPHVLDFSVNVNPLGPSPRAVDAARQALAHIDAYPDRESRALTRALAASYGVPAESIVCGAGASDLICRLAAALRPRRAIVCAPTFSEYAEAATRFGADVQEVPLSEEDGFDVPCAFARAIAGPGDVAFLCSPNNPTGRLIAPDVLTAVADRCEKTGALLVVDECFLGFSPDAASRSLAVRAGSSRHVAVLSAFTKFYGMAGLRLGYLICGNADILEGVRAVGQIWPVSSVAEAAGAAALLDTDYLARTRRVVESERAWLARELSALGLSVVPSSANYLLFRAPESDLGKRLYERGILVRTCASFSGLSSFWYRVAVRTRKENETLVCALARVLEDACACKLGEGAPASTAAPEAQGAADAQRAAHRITKEADANG